MSGDDPYVYPGTHILKNRFEIHDAAALDIAERAAVTQRIAQGVPTGNFDLGHLRAIHHHLFQDVFDWAGEVRTVEISKGGDQFMARHYIENGMRDIHRRVVDSGFLGDLAPDDFAQQAGPIISDVNHVHPFREGNGRTQLQYLEQLAARAGHRIDLNKLEPARWIEASRQANRKNDEPMSRCIAETMTGPERAENAREQLLERLNRTTNPPELPRGKENGDRDR